MARFLFRSCVSTIVTMLLVSVVLFALLAVGGGDVTVKILGVFATDEQRESLSKQLGLDAPVTTRYFDWLIGNDFRARRRIGYPVVTLRNPQSNDVEWWVRIDGEEMQFELGDEGELIALVRNSADGTTDPRVADDLWQVNDAGEEFFWGVDNRGRAVKWDRGGDNVAYVTTQTGWQEIQGAPTEYIPLRKGLLRGDPGFSFRTNRPVSSAIFLRLRNTVFLAGIAFVVVMPLALVLGILAGVNEGKTLDRIISIGGLIGTSTPEFVTGMLLILIFAVGFKVLPAVSVFTSADAIFRNPRLIILPVLTLTTVELGYIVRMTRASMVEVMNTSYIRTAIIKGMPFRRVVMRHAIRNALMAPITVIMLHVNYFIGGIVIVETIFGYPGLGTYIYDSAIFGDVNALEAAAMITVLVAVTTRLLGDLAYTWLNPRIRYS